MNLKTIQTSLSLIEALTVDRECYCESVEDHHLASYTCDKHEVERELEVIRAELLKATDKDVDKFLQDNSGLMDDLRSQETPPKVDESDSQQALNGINTK